MADITVLYLQPAEEISRAVGARFENDENIDFVVVDSAAKAIEQIKEGVDLLLADCYVPDMKLIELLELSVRSCPELVINVCMDMADSRLTETVANMKNVSHIYLVPWEIDEIEEGIRISVDEIVLRKDLARHVRALKEDEEQFNVSLYNLKDALLKQRHSYHKLSNILMPFADFVVELSDKEIDSKNFIKKCCEKLLRTVTTAKIDVDRLEDHFRTEIGEAYSGDSDFTIGNICSCISGEHEKDKLSSVVYCVWLTAVLQQHRTEGGSISILSENISTDLCRYEVSLSGKNKDDYPAELDVFTEGVLKMLCRDYKIENEDAMTRYVMEFEI